MAVRWLLLCLVAAVPACATVTDQEVGDPENPIYLLNDKPVSAEVYQAALLTNEGIDLSHANRLLEAKQKLTEAIQIAPDYLNAYYNLGVVLMRLKEDAQAEKHLEFTVVSGADFPPAWLALAQVRQSRRKYREAVDTFLDALNRYPEQTWRDIPEFYLSYGDALVKLGELDKAIVQLKLAVRSKGALPDSWLALGTTYQTAKRYPEASEVFAEALKRYPRQTWNAKPEVYLNYGLALMEVGEFDKAIEQMKTALNAQADFPELWGSLGSLYQGSGRLEDAIFYYKEFIRRFPNRPEALIFVDSIKSIENEIELIKAHGTSVAEQRTAKDYYAAITRNGARLWPSEKMPLKVQIESGDGVLGFDPRFGEILRTAFDEWSKASEGKVTFRFVDNSADADIRCSWTSDPSHFKNRGEGGEATVFYDPTTGTVQTATIVILTVPTMGLQNISDNQMRSVALHEVGHALGLIEHSPNPADIMFFAGWPSNIKRALTDRDRETILRLYASNPSSVSVGRR